MAKVRADRKMDPVAAATVTAARDSVRAAVDLGTAMVVVKAETEGVVTPPAMQIQAKRYMRWKTRK
jgi:hypothetical protein